MRDIKLEVKQTNVLLREDVNISKLMLNQLIEAFNDYKIQSDKKFNKVFETLRAREGMYRAANMIKWGVAIIFAGVLTAVGASIWNHYTLTSNPKIEIVE